VWRTEIVQVTADGLGTHAIIKSAGKSQAVHWAPPTTVSFLILRAITGAYARRNSSVAAGTGVSSVTRRA